MDQHKLVTKFLWIMANFPSGEVMGDLPVVQTGARLLISNRMVTYDIQHKRFGHSCATYK